MEHRSVRWSRFRAWGAPGIVASCVWVLVHCGSSVDDGVDAGSDASPPADATADTRVGVDAGGADAERDGAADANRDTGGDGSVDADAGPPPPVALLEVGGDHACIVTGQGKAKCWGENGFGELGLGDTQSRGRMAGQMGASLPFVDLGGGRTVKAIHPGWDDTCAVLDDGSVRCWGIGGGQALGLGDFVTRGDGPGEMGAALPAVDLGPGRRAIDVRTGRTTCALLDDGSVRCWGRATDGQLGSGGTAFRGGAPTDMGASLPAVDLGPGRRATRIGTGFDHVCAVLDDGSLRCWGKGGRLGLGDMASRGDQPGEMGASLPAVDLGAGRKVVTLSVGATHTCVILDDRSLRCFGTNASGELGLGDTNARGDEPGEMGASLPAVDFGPGRYATAVAAGAGHTCAILDDRTVRCWGLNDYGQLGRGNRIGVGSGPNEMGTSLPAVDLGTGKKAAAISCGSAFSCALLDDATVKCWGFNDFGQLGQGDRRDRGDNAGEMGDALPPIALE